MPSKAAAAASNGKAPRVKRSRQLAPTDIDKLTASDGIATVLLDRAMRIRSFTAGATALFNFLPSDVGRPIRDLAQNFEDPTFLSDILLVLEGKNAARKEVLSAGGRWYVRHTLPYLLSGGTIEGAVITFSDLDADALEEVRSFAESIVDTVREPLLVLDENLLVQFINPSFAELFQVSSRQVLGQTLCDLDKGVWEVPEMLALLKGLFESGNSMEEFEIGYQSETFGQRTLVLNARMLVRGGGRPRLILVAIDDVTERRHLQQLLHENETRVREEERIWQRQLELTNAMRVSTVGELATGLAHELNQPLSSISNLVGACAEHVRVGTMNPARQLKLLADIASESQRAAGIIAHLRSFIDNGEPQLGPVDLVEIVRRAARLMARDLEQTRIELVAELPGAPMCVDADTIQIEQVVVNLFQNAMDSIREAQRPIRRIELSVRALGGAAEVSVRDTGTGISGSAADRMFEAFFTTKPEGLGMGLALSRSIVEAHRGHLWFDAPPDGGFGAIVRFSMPLNASTPHIELQPL